MPKVFLLGVWEAQLLNCQMESSLIRLLFLNQLPQIKLLVSTVIHQQSLHGCYDIHFDSV